MVRIDINTYLTTNYNNNATEINNSHKSTPTDILFGKLELKNYPNLKKIELGGNELERAVIIDCPSLELIKVEDNKITELDIEKIKTSNGGNDPAPADKLEALWIGNNVDLEKVSVENCPELKKFYAPNTDKLDKVPGLDGLKKINNISVSDGLLRLIIPEKLDYYKKVVKVVRETLGMNPNDSVANILPTLKSKINDKVIAVQNPQLKNDKENAEKARDEAQAKLEAQKDYEDIKQQLTAIRNELGLTESTTKEQIIDEIKKLKNRPTSGCSHTDYDSIKTEKDRLKTDNESKKRKIAELEGNKENESVITKKVLTETTNTNWENWGVKISSGQIKSIQDAASAEKVEEIRNEIITGEFSKLKDENNSSFYLNIGLGALTIGSLLILFWMLMKQNNLPEKESKERKRKIRQLKNKVGGR